MGGRKEKTAAGAHRIPAGRFRKDGNVCGTFRGRRRTVLLTKTGPSRYPLRNQRLQRESGERVPCHPEFPRGADQKLEGIQREYHALTEHADRRAYFMEKRAFFNEGGPDDVTRAALFIFFMRTCYNGIYSVNRSGKLSVTFGAGNRAKILEEELIRVNHGLLQGVTILEATTTRQRSMPERKPSSISILPTSLSTSRAAVPPTCRTTSTTTTRSAWLSFAGIWGMPAANECSPTRIRARRIRPIPSSMIYTTLPYPAAEHLSLGLLHRRETETGQRAADKELLMRADTLIKQSRRVGDFLPSACSFQPFHIR